MRNSAKTSFTLLAVACVALFGAVVQPALSQTASFERAQGREMLNAIKSDIRKGYYDPTFRGKDLDAHFKAAEEKIGQAPSMGYILAIIAQALIDFNDSHTYFVLPPPSAHVEPGWRLRMIGDKLYVVAVRPKSDAEVKGLAPGDRVLTIDGFTPSRDPRWQISFAYYLQKANPQTIFLVEKPDGSQQTITVIAEVKEGRRMLNLGNSNGTDLFNLIRESQNDAYLNRHRYYEIGDQAIIWKMPNFELSEAQISELMGKARKRKALILDLRGNGGGSEAVLQRLVGHLFDHDIKIGDLKRRKETKPLLAKTRSDEVFKGQLVILLDSESGSAAELLARVVQLEKRGTVIGDRSAGAVMRSLIYEHRSGVGVGFSYGVSVTDADIVMTDGQSLENIGVVPDELVLPAATDLARQRDPALARAATLIGLTIDPDKAGRFFPVEWKK